MEFLGVGLGVGEVARLFAGVGADRRALIAVGDSGRGRRRELFTRVKSPSGKINALRGRGGEVEREGERGRGSACE